MAAVRTWSIHRKDNIGSTIYIRSFILIQYPENRSGFRHLPFECKRQSRSLPQNSNRIERDKLDGMADQDIAAKRKTFVICTQQFT